jgi:outer membrane biosynthesis protein TonB
MADYMIDPKNFYYTYHPYGLAPAVTATFPANYVKLKQFPDRDIIVFHGKSGWIVVDQKTGAKLGKTKTSEGWYGFNTREQAVENYLAKQTTLPQEPNLIQQEADRLSKIYNSLEYRNLQADYLEAVRKYGQHAKETLILQKQLLDMRGGVQIVKVPQPVAPIPATIVKEPWRMTKEEYVSSIEKTQTGLRYHGGLTEKQAIQMHISAARTNHEYFVKQALSESKPVPAEVLVDYPDLIKKSVLAPVAKKKITPAVVEKPAPKPKPVVTPEPPPKEKPVAYKTVTSLYEERNEQLRTLNKRKAKDVEYKLMLSPLARTPLNKGETWKMRAESYVYSLKTGVKETATKSEKATLTLDKKIAALTAELARVQRSFGIKSMEPKVSTVINVGEHDVDDKVAFKLPGHWEVQGGKWVKILDKV